jgi:hypothetical protein
MVWGCTLRSRAMRTKTRSKGRCDRLPVPCAGPRYYDGSGLRDQHVAQLRVGAGELLVWEDPWGYDRRAPSSPEAWMAR